MDNGIFGLALVGLFILAYFLPSVIAEKRLHKNKIPIAIVNLFFGWTILGWVICLAWSTSSNVFDKHQKAS